MVFNPLPIKASISGRGRGVVYLDQNVVSDLARLRLGRQTENGRTEALRALLNTLRTCALESESIRCVESFFHLWESSGLVKGDALPRAKELFDDIWNLLVVHAWGLKFHTPHRATEFQALVTIAAETRLLEYAQEYLWRGAFNHDPNEKNEKRGVRAGDDLFLLGIPWQPSSLLKPGWAAAVESSRVRGRYASFDVALRELRTELREVALEDNRRLNWAGRWGGDRGRQMSAAAVLEFVSAEVYGELPTNDVLTRVGARVLSDRCRPLQDGDGADMRILSLAIPYCDLVITDRYMASVANSLRLGKKYSTKILPSSTDGLRDAAQWLASFRPSRATTAPGARRIEEQGHP